ncbi:hypothetical protein QYF36_009819 [Acer negundo]|nr:hypothetical protein QYF36_009819 [Acer negundo]
MEFLSFLFTALMPVLKVLLVTAVGLFLATECVNLLGANARQHLNEISTEALLPSNDYPSSEDHSDQVEPPHTRFEGKMKVLLRSVKQHLEKFSEKINLKMVFSPSTIAAVVGLAIGLISPIRKWQ